MQKAPCLKNHYLKLQGFIFLYVDYNKQTYVFLKLITYSNYIGVSEKYRNISICFMVGNITENSLANLLFKAGLDT